MRNVNVPINGNANMVGAKSERASERTAHSVWPFSMILL